MPLRPREPLQRLLLRQEKFEDRPIGVLQADRPVPRVPKDVRPRDEEVEPLCAPVEQDPELRPFSTADSPPRLPFPLPLELLPQLFESPPLPHWLRFRPLGHPEPLARVVVLQPHGPLEPMRPKVQPLELHAEQLPLLVQPPLHEVFP